LIEALSKRNSQLFLQITGVILNDFENIKKNTSQELTVENKDNEETKIIINETLNADDPRFVINEL
jgi:hypothetical protein